MKINGVFVGGYNTFLSPFEITTISTLLLLYRDGEPLTRGTHCDSLADSSDPLVVSKLLEKC